MLSGHLLPTHALLYLANPEPERIIDPTKNPDSYRKSEPPRASDPGKNSPWSSQAQAIIDATDESLLRLYDAPDLEVFRIRFTEMNNLLLQSLLVPLFYRRGKPLNLREIFEQAGTIAWGPLEVARVLFENKFKAELSKNDEFANRIYEDEIVPAVKEIEHAVLYGQLKELVIHLQRTIHFDRKQAPLLLGPKIVQTGFAFGLRLLNDGIILDVDVPARLSLRPDFPLTDIKSVNGLFKTLLNFMKTLHDPLKADMDRLIHISWIPGGQAIAIADNGIVIEDVKAVWPFRLSDERPINCSVPIHPALVELRDTLQKMAWRMTLDSKAGQGSCFTIYPLPGDIFDPDARRKGRHISGPPQYGAVTINYVEESGERLRAEAEESPEIEVGDAGISEEELLGGLEEIETPPLLNVTKAR